MSKEGKACCFCVTLIITFTTLIIVGAVLLGTDTSTDWGIALIVIGCLLFLIWISFIIYGCWRIKKDNKEDSSSGPTVVYVVGMDTLAGQRQAQSSASTSQRTESRSPAAATRQTTSSVQVRSSGAVARTTNRSQATTSGAVVQRTTTEGQQTQLGAMVKQTRTAGVLTEDGLVVQQKETIIQQTPLGPILAEKTTTMLATPSESGDDDDCNVHVSTQIKIIGGI